MLTKCDKAKSEIRSDAKAERESVETEKDDLETNASSSGRRRSSKSR